MVVFLILLICSWPCIEAKLQKSNSLTDVKNALHPEAVVNDTYFIEVDEAVNDISTYNDTTLFNTFFNVLVDVSFQQFQKIKDNIITNLEIPSTEVLEIRAAFADLQLKYLGLVRTRLTQIIQANKTYNVTDHFMIDFMDVSNYIFEKVVEFYMQNVKEKGNRGIRNKWYQKTESQKLLRQQIKVSKNYIENHMCDNLQVCRDRYYYSDYIIDWIRTLMNLGDQDLKRFFAPVPEVLEKHKHLIKSNIKFRQTIKYLINAESCVKRDTLDFLDEILTNPDRVAKLAPEALKMSVSLLRDLFVLIDSAYDINDQNVENLESISEWLRDWVDGKKLDVYKILDGIVENIQVNLRIWPLDVQNKIYYIWSELIVL